MKRKMCEMMNIMSEQEYSDAVTLERCLYGYYRKNKKIMEKPLIDINHIALNYLDKHCCTNAICSEEDEQAAMDAIKNFYHAYKAISEKRKYAVYRGHFTYFINLNLIDIELSQKRYCSACNKIISLFAYEPTEQARIHRNLLFTLERHLNFDETLQK